MPSMPVMFVILQFSVKAATQTGCSVGDDGNALLQGKIKLDAFTAGDNSLNSDAPSLTAMPVNVLLREVERMVQGVANATNAGNKSANTSSDLPTRDSMIRTIRTMVQDIIMPGLIEAHTLAHRQLSDEKAKIDLCIKDADDSFRLVEDMKYSTSIAEDQHKACRVEEQVLAKNMRLKCDELQIFLDGAKDRMKPPPADMTLGLVWNHLLQQHRLFLELEQKNHSCNTSTEAHATKKASCDQMQSSFESDFCQYRTAVDSTAHSFTICNATSTEAYYKLRNTTQDEVAKWKVEYKAIKNIECFLKTWLGDENVSINNTNLTSLASVDNTSLPSNVSIDNTSSLSACDGKNIDASVMDVAYPIVPETETDAMQSRLDNFIDLVNPYPGIGAFLDRYNDLPTHSTAVAGCLTYTTPTTTTTRIMAKMRLARSHAPNQTQAATTTTTQASPKKAEKASPKKAAQVSPKTVSAKKVAETQPKIESAYGCTTGSGTGCATCVTQASRTSATDCATCNVGYYQSGTTCQATTTTTTQAYGCTTGSGTGCATCVTQSTRTSATDCATCNVGYYQSGTTCQAYSCTTASGTGCATCVTQASRTSPTDCATCNVGYYLSGITCQACAGNGVMYGDRFIQFGNWRIGDYDGVHASIAHKDGQTEVIFRSDGSVHGGPRTDFSTWSRTVGTPSGISFGDRFIQIGDWRIGDFDGDHFSFSHKDGKTAQAFRKDGSADMSRWRSQTDFSTWSRTVGTPSGISIGDRFIQIGDWRIGDVNGNHASVSHKDGQTPMVYRQDGTAHAGPRTDWSTWHRNVALICEATTTTTTTTQLSFLEQATNSPLVRIPVPDGGACDVGLSKHQIKASCEKCNQYYDARFDNTPDSYCQYVPDQNQCVNASWAASTNLTTKTDCRANNFSLLVRSVAARRSHQRQAGARETLSSMKPSELKRKAEALGATQEEIENTMDDDYPKAALIDLLVCKQSAANQAAE